MKFYHGQLNYFLGEDQQSLAVRRILAGRHPENLFHDHNYSEFVLVESGEAEHIAGGKRCLIRAGDVLLLHPGIIHAYDRTKRFQIVNVIYDSRTLAPPMLDCWQLPLFQHFYPGNNALDPDVLLKPILHLKKEYMEKVSACITLLQRELDDHRPGSQFGAFIRFMEFTLLLARYGQDKQARSCIRDGISRAIAFINEHGSEKVTIEQLLKCSSMSRRNFFRNFRLVVGCPPIEYLIRKRLHHAASELLYPGREIGEIAWEAGFSDSNFFSKQFRKEFHCSPSEFRRAHLKSE